MTKFFTIGIGTMFIGIALYALIFAMSMACIVMGGSPETCGM